MKHGTKLEWIVIILILVEATGRPFSMLAIGGAGNRPALLHAGRVSSKSALAASSTCEPKLPSMERE